MFLGRLAQVEFGGGGGLRLGEALVGVGGLDRVVVLRQGTDRVDHAPADQPVVTGDRAFRGLLDLGDHLAGRPAGMLGLDQGGYAGFNDEVNNHYLRIFGSALLMSLFSAGIQLSQPQPNASSNDVYSSQQIIAGAVGQQLGNAGIEIIQKGLNIAPTLIIRPGYLFNVMVTKDIVVPPYQTAAAH